MFVDFNILNQLGSPSINSNTFANRPAAGQTGRLFVSTDTFEIYRDNGTGWDLIGGPGSSTVTGSGATGQVTYWTGTNTVSGENALFWDAAQNHLGINTATPTVALDVHSAADVALQLNGTGATPSIFQQFLSAGVSQYQVGYNWDASADYRRFSIYDSQGSKEVISIDQQSRYVGINYQYSSLSDQPAYTLDVSGSGRFTDSAFFATDNVSSVGINTTIASGKLHVLSTTNGINNVTLSRYVQSPHLVFNAYQGTISTPTAIQNGDEILKISSQGYNGTSVATVGYITYNASENFTSIGNGAEIQFYTTRNGTTGANKIATFTNDGNFNLGNSLQNERLSILGPNISGATVSWQNTARAIGYLYSDGGGVGIYQNSIVANGIYFSQTTEQYFYINGSAAINIKTNQNVIFGGTTDNGNKVQINGSTFISGNLDAGNTGGSVTAGDLNIDTTSLASKVIIGRLSSVGSDNTLLTGRSRIGTIGWEIDAFGFAKFTGTSGKIQTSAPTTGTSGVWKLGTRVAAAVVLDATQYIEVEVDGTFYKLAIVT